MSSSENLERLYTMFNARDMDGLLSLMHRDVRWANGMEGGHVHGLDGVRDYWTRQWSMIDPHVEPTSFLASGEQQTEVHVHQIVRDLEGKVLSDSTVRHFFQFEDGLIQSFDIR